MYRACQITWQATHAKNKLNMFGDVDVSSFKILDHERMSEVMIRFKVKIKIGNHWQLSFPRVICEKAAFKPDINGKWGVNPVSFLKMQDDEQGA